MNTIAVYNMKGGVGKTTTAVNLAYLAAETGHRTLLWDLDAQGAATFAFRVKPRVAGLSRNNLAEGSSLAAAIRQTDFDNLYVLPAAFAYRKLDRWLSSFGHPHRVFSALLEALGREFDLVLLDCPPGVSTLIEATLAAADAAIAPTIPTVLSLRTLGRLFSQADRVRARCTIAPFFNMVDRRKTLHRRVCELAAPHCELFLSTHIPYASAVEQVAARRMPLALFAPHEPATRAFADLWMELQRRMQSAANSREDRPWTSAKSIVDALVDCLETAERPVPTIAPVARDTEPRTADHAAAVVHRFDTDQEDLKRDALAIELHEQHGEFLVAARSDAAAGADDRAEARIDRWWTVQILAGEMSPLEALERRTGSPRPRVLERIRAALGPRLLRRVETQLGTPGDLKNPAAAVEHDSVRAVGF